MHVLTFLLTLHGSAFLQLRESFSLEHLTIKTPQPTPACGHPSEGGERLKSPPLEGCRNGGVGFSTYCETTSQALNDLAFQSPVRNQGNKPSQSLRPSTCGNEKMEGRRLSARDRTADLIYLSKSFPSAFFQRSGW